MPPRVQRPSPRLCLVPIASAVAPHVVVIGVVTQPPVRRVRPFGAGRLEVRRGPPGLTCTQDVGVRRVVHTPAPPCVFPRLPGLALLAGLQVLPSTGGLMGPPGEVGSVVVATRRRQKTATRPEVLGSPMGGRVRPTYGRHALGSVRGGKVLRPLMAGHRPFTGVAITTKTSSPVRPTGHVAVDQVNLPIDGRQVLPPATQTGLSPFYLI